ncbi:UAP56-interacting factor-like [Acanthaster planci]|uniref:UAP56-interacting factor-like n=1 Tax=Acanthaster planci TaxID=133434 RepID=A0A8B7YQZ6_ACAPL|nr:UAP56-interacting factor-like [Acanthaster planci]
MDKIDMSLDDIIKQNRKENRKLAVQKKKAAAGLKNRPSGPAGQRQAKKPGLAKTGLGVRGRASQLKQFRARIGGKKTVGKGVALTKKKGAAKVQQQGGVVANRGPARKVGKQRVPVKRIGGAQVVNRYRRQQQQQQQQVQQRLQQSKAARQQRFNQQRGIQTIPQGGGRKKVQLNRQNFVSAQTNSRQINRQQTNTLQQQQPQFSQRQRQKNKRLLQNQPAQRANLARPQRPKAQRAKQLRANAQKVNPKLLTVSISNPKAMQNYKPVKINRNKPKMQISGGTLNDRFGQLQQQQQPKNAPNTNRQRRRRKQQGQGQGQNTGGRTVLLV